MSTLRLRIHKYLEGQQNPPQVFASIRSIGKSGARNKEQPVLEELIPVSDKPEKAKEIEVTPGHYYVEAVLPSGELLSEDVEVKSDQTKEVVLKADDSPHEWLSWQQISGNVQPTPKVKKTPAPISVYRERNPLGMPNTTLRHAKFIRTPESLESVVFVPKEEPEVQVQSPLRWLTEPHASLSKGDPTNSWKFLSTLTGTSAVELINKLNNGKISTPIPPAVSDDEHGVFRVSSQPASGVLRRPLTAGERTYIAIPRRNSVELLSVPLPWKVLSTGRQADIEIAVQEPADPRAFCSSAIARDEDCGMLLGYLSSGSLPMVRRIAERGKERLYYKSQNPFAAAAGAYALVGTALHASDRDWHQWVLNLKNNFPYMPDGAIQWGMLMMRMRRTAEDIAEAVNAFKAAYGRGLPFYSMGIKWLLEGLEWAADNDPEAKKMAAHVRPIAWRTNYQQPFTTLRIGGDPNA